MCYNSSSEILSKFSGFSSKLLTRSLYLPFGLLSTPAPKQPRLVFDIRFFKCLPFESYSATFIHTHLIRSSMGNVGFFFFLPSSWSPNTFCFMCWLGTYSCYSMSDVFFFFLMGNLLGIEILKHTFNDSFFISRRSLKWSTFGRHKQIVLFSIMCMSIVLPDFTYA
jgi:hypothetical protein